MGINAGFVKRCNHGCKNMARIFSVRIIWFSNALLFVFIFLNAISPANCFCEELPSYAHDRLGILLKNPEFQNHKKDASSYVDEFVKELKVWALDKVIRALRAVRNAVDKMPKPSKDIAKWFSDLFDWITPKWSSVELFLKVVVVCIFVFLIVRLWKRLSPFIKNGLSKNTGVPTFVSSDVDITNIYKESVADLLSAGFFVKALCVVRIRLRKLISEHYGVKLSLTDREIIKHIKVKHVSEHAADNKDKDSRLLSCELFQKVATRFESCVYAHSNFNEQDVSAICLQANDYLAKYDYADKSTRSHQT